MPRSTGSFLFPDIDVWIALTCAGHVHHEIARDWFSDLDEESRFSFCRFTQLGLLRLLTAEAVMGDEAMNQPEAWKAYDRWLQDDRVDFMDEPRGLEIRFRTGTRLRHPATKDWARPRSAAGWVSASYHGSRLRVAASPRPPIGETDGSRGATRRRGAGATIWPGPPRVSPRPGTKRPME